MSSDNNQRFWEFYLVRYLVPSIVAGVCVAYIFIAKDYVGDKDFKSLIEWFDKNFNAVMFIAWGIISFAIMYIFSGITMLIHSLRSLFIKKCPGEFYLKSYETYGYTLKVDKYKESYRHFREHGTAFEVSLIIFIFTILIEPKILSYYYSGTLCIVLVSLIGTIAGSYFGIYLELYRYLKENYGCSIHIGSVLLIFFVPIIVYGTCIWSTFHNPKISMNVCDENIHKHDCQSGLNKENTMIPLSKNKVISFNESSIIVKNMNINSFNTNYESNTSFEYHFNGSYFKVGNLNIDSYNGHQIVDVKHKVNANICK